jgi:hypothetical protein
MVMGDNRPRYANGKIAHVRLQEWQRIRPIGRQKPRAKHYWQLADIGRIAVHLADKERPPDYTRAQVLVEVARALGYGDLFCRLLRSVNSSLVILAAIEKIAAVLAGGQLLTAVIEWLMEKELSAPVQLKVVIALAILALLLVDKVIKAVGTIAGDLADLRELVTVLEALCGAAGGEVGECNGTSVSCQTAITEIDQHTQDLAQQINLELIS